MMQLICFFAPPLLSAYIYEKREKELFSIKRFAVTYATFAGIINMLCLGTVAILLRHPDYVLNFDMISIGFSFKYLLLGYVFAVILPVACSIIKKCIQIEFVVETEYKDGQEEAVSNGE